MTTHDVSKITQQESRRRREDVDRIVHSARMEGGEVSEEATRDLDAYVEGTMSAAEGLARVRSRYGLDQAVVDGSH